MNQKQFIQLPYLILLITTLCQCQSKPKGDSKSEEPSYQALSETENQTWIYENLSSVMQPHTFSATNGLALPYRIFVPSDLKPDEQLPLLIHLHGRGERGTDNTPKTYNNIPLFNGPNAIVSPNMQHRYRCIVLVPQCSNKTTNEEWAKWVGNTPETPFEGLEKDGSYTMNETPSESGAAALELIDTTITQYHIDTARVYLTGLSMGGFGTWEFIARRPDLFAAAVPMAGYSDPSQVERIKHIPVWIFHGDIDQYNPVAGSRNMHQLLAETGADVRYTEYTGLGHGETFQKAWTNDMLIPWMFNQRKTE
ncbi:prolyl oligopeptidase family serine peptidase [Reichenbachiella agariperforans]|uniref:carboxylesterase family protein n=1 Tax=Reichenbachiella agariperforans TaxID=156994 RepID=UPI001C089FA8|nr:prolyl oligopeptidase family serine peptidase [Reichenbachiella agariperforans]MBU2913322.1 prolyl oligopeptidase family serine peptidase [Reichenbachiella agariperforans]